MDVPGPRGPISAMLVERLRERPGWIATPGMTPNDALADDDLHLALYLCYELSYRGLSGVDERWEWEPSLIAFRAALERRFEERLREELPDEVPKGSMADALRRVIAEDDAPSLSAYFEAHGTLEQFREFVVHRSAYQLKEADPHSWAIPRLDGRAKAALVAIQHEEYGEGRPASMHAELFRRTMRALGLDAGYGAYIDAVPGTTLATVNLMSLFGLHRRHVGAIVGHLAIFEMTSTQPNERYANALRRMGASEDARAFYDEHVEADATHEVIASSEMAGGLVQEEPERAADILFGARSLLLLEGRFAGSLLEAWRDGRTSLRIPLESDGDDVIRPAAALAGRR